MAKKPYTMPTIKQLCPMPVEQRATIWDIHHALDEWSFASIYDLYDFLKLAKGAGASIDALIVVLGNDIKRAF